MCLFTPTSLDHVVPVYYRRKQFTEDQTKFDRSMMGGMPGKFGEISGYRVGFMWESRFVLARYYYRVWYFS